jgi:hypothetical protein
MNSEEISALVVAYLKFKERWWIFLGTFLLTLLLFGGALTNTIFADLTPFVVTLGILLILSAVLCYVSQFLLIHEMAERMHFPRVSHVERGFWYTLMLLGLVALAPGMILEAGLFLLYARKFISHAKAVPLGTTARA